MNRQTYHAKNHEVDRRWVVVDATDQVYGRLASRIARILQGKNKPEYTPHHDVGDFVVVTNVEKMHFTGRKLDQKLYQNYSGYPGGLKTYTYRTMLEQHPERLLEKAVRRMMPRNRLGRQQFSKMKVYRGPEHPHTAQQPEALEITAKSA
ncbi:50S ribosomal protein L13 [Phycisphaerales bacterium AB-hyl4]|uniref:Large ribosomal subunit protein uL13 n=1 Tax=Natronomicrosphaera hydrolytica TaxID=3242702 RepID=A0ABV4U1N7_9BACT